MKSSCVTTGWMRAFFGQFSLSPFFVKYGYRHITPAALGLCSDETKINQDHGLIRLSFDHTYLTQVSVFAVQVYPETYNSCWPDACAFKYAMTHALGPSSTPRTLSHNSHLFTSQVSPGSKLISSHSLIDCARSEYLLMSKDHNI